jgi:hypothetical protein
VQGWWRHPEGRQELKVLRAAEFFLVHASDPDSPKQKTGIWRCISAVRQAAAVLPRRPLERRMDDSTKGPRPTVSEISEVARDGLILWHLTMSGDRNLWCLVFEAAIGFLLVVEDHPEGTEPPRISERHTDIIALVDRMDILKDHFVRDGWTEVDVD